ncbi:MAG: GreA/GreB family elongation factor [bacterium]|nr:GreA/GreB family elongation factor [bacterium]
MIETKYYVTKQGLQKLEKDYQQLLEFKKKKTTGDDVPSIWHSEEVNPDYLAFQEDMSLLEAKLVELELILKNRELITTPPKKEQNVVHLGARITVKVDDGQVDEFELVGTLEASPSLGKISNESPVGSAFLGRRVGEEVVVSSPQKTVYRITKVKYVSP